MYLAIILSAFKLMLFIFLFSGGLKIWECTHDLIKYLITNKRNIILENTNVLDLGCGSGILGIYTFINGASVTFQDYVSIFS